MVVVHFGGASAPAPKPQYFDCNVQINTTKGKTVNGYKNLGDNERYDYFNKGQTLYSTKGAKMDGETWYQVQAYNANNQVITMWVNGGTSGVKVIDLNEDKKVPPSMSFSPGSVTLKPGNSATISINFKGDGISKLVYAIGNTSVCNAGWGNTDWRKGTSSLKISAKNPGSTTVTVNYLDDNGKEFYSKGFDVVVNNYDTKLSVSPSQVNLDLVDKPSQVVTITLGGSYPSDGKLGGKSSGVVKGSWVSAGVINNRAEMRLSAQEVGTGTSTYRFTSADGTVLATATVNVTVTAPTYTVTYDANGGSGAPSRQTKEYNKSLTLSSREPVRSGYRFNGWAVSSSASSPNYTPGSTYSANSSLSLYAVWAPASGVPYTVRHYLDDGNGPELEDTDTFTGTTGERVSPSPREYLGYEAPDSQSARVAADGSTVIEYVYEAITHTVRIKSDDGIDDTWGEGTYRYGETVTVSAQVEEGYTWRQWESSADQVPGSTEQKYSFTMPDEEVVLWATCDEIPQPDCSEGHTWGRWVVTEEATCEEEGQRERTCEVCGEKEREWIDPLEHDYEAVSETDAYIRYVCANCGDDYTEEKQAREAEYTVVCRFEYADLTSTVERETYTGLVGETVSPVPEVYEGFDTPVRKSATVEEDGSTVITYVYVAVPSTPHADGLDNFTNRNSYYDGLFEDVSVNHWAQHYIATAYKLGLMNGTGSGSFSPGNNMTIAEAITLAARIHAIYHTGEEDFPRYDGGNWYDPYVNYARDKGIITENYVYTRPATREEFVHIMAAALPEEALPAITPSITFADASDIIYGADVDLLQRSGVINGIEDNGEFYFKPWNTITRGEVAKLVTSMVKEDLRQS